MTAAPSDERRLIFGTDEAVGDSVALRAGPLDLTLAGGKLRHIRLGDLEVWHGVSFVYRDPHWGTPEPIIQRLETRITDSAFSLRCEGCFPTDPVISLTVDIEGDGAGVIRFAAEAIPAADIETNRLGICVMHPMACAGARVEVEHIDGRLSQSVFPTLIPPWPPFMLIRAIRHEYMTGRWARCEFSGDAFELEDQRNNSDASFKTYSRSNLMPRPYWLRGQLPIRQAVVLKLDSHAPRASVRQSGALTVRVGEECADLPRIGMEISSHATASEADAALLGVIRPALLHLSLEENESASVDWHAIRDLLLAAGAQLRLDVTIADGQRAAAILSRLAADLRDADVAPESLAIFPSEPRWIAAGRQAFPHTPVGGGTPFFFVQLNRAERLGDIDFLTFTTSPIVHGTDDDSVMLSLQSLGSMIATLRAQYPSLAVRVGPSGIGVRKSPLGSQPMTDGMRRVALAQQDPRSRGLFGAAWWLGYVAQFAYAGVDAISLSRIVAEPDPGQATATQPSTYPSYCVLQRLGPAARISSVFVSDSARIAALALRRGGERELLVANLTGDTVEADLEGWPASCPAAMLDVDSLRVSSRAADAWAARPASPRQRLRPYAVASFRQTAKDESA